MGGMLKVLEDGGGIGSCGLVESAEPVSI